MELRPKEVEAVLKLDGNLGPNGARIGGAVKDVGFFVRTMGCKVLFQWGVA